ncbi:MAG: VRR-NUC domain-containing protein [Clostridia bacterium]
MPEPELEKTITNQIIRALKGDGYPVVVKIFGNAFQASGLPDLIVIARNGRFVGLEVKRPKVGRVTPLQDAMLRRINHAGGYAVVVRSVDEARAAMAAAENWADEIIKEGLT